MPRVKKQTWPDDLTPFVVETITMPDYLDEEGRWPRCQIQLIDVNGTWSFSFELRIELWSHSFPSMPNYRKSCKSRRAAFDAARIEIMEDIEKDWKIRGWKGPRPMARRVMAWIEDLRFEGQLHLNLFNTR